jgi:hypothetical protein
MEEDLIVSLPVAASPQVRPARLLVEIWREVTFGIGVWGTARPIIAVIVAIVPFAYLGQHMNREHRKAFDYTLLQIPLALSIFLWPLLYLWSIVDAWRGATAIVSKGGLPAQGVQS